MLLDTEIDFVTAMIVSVRAVLASPVPMLAWGVVVTALTIVALAVPPDNTVRMSPFWSVMPVLVCPLDTV